MIHLHSLDEVRLPEAYLTIGVFDGVHRGHQALMERLIVAARAARLPAVVLTFWPHPAVVLGQVENWSYLTTAEERAALLADLGVDVVITQSFDHHLAAQSAAEFMRRLTQALPLRRLFIGYDFALGRGREGDAARLRELGRLFGYEVETIAPRRQGDTIISTTAIRAHLLAGRVEAAAALLGRPYALRGEVVRGEGRGRQLQFPTANLIPPKDKLIPAHGVYACWSNVNGQRYLSVVNIGFRPTFDAHGGRTFIESHLLDFSADLYGQTMVLEFVARLRDEKKFPSASALVEQIRRDVQQARQRLIS
jgi:riboflavin kinase/FMN adenylyltransferase